MLLCVFKARAKRTHNGDISWVIKVYEARRSLLDDFSINSSKQIRMILRTVICVMYVLR